MLKVLSFIQAIEAFEISEKYSQFFSTSGFMLCPKIWLFFNFKKVNPDLFPHDPLTSLF